MRWVGYVARIGEKRGCRGSWWRKRRKEEHWRDVGVDVWIIPGWIARRWEVGLWTEMGWSRIETGGGLL